MSKNSQSKKAETASNVIYIFVDEANLREGQRLKGRFLEYEKAAEYIQQRYAGTCVKVFFYTAYPGKGTRNYDIEKKQRYYRYVKTALGFKVRKKPLKRMTVLTQNGTETIEKGNMDIEMAIDVMHNIKEFHAAAFLTGDSDFLALVTYLQRNGKKVFAFAFEGNASHELRQGADDFTYIGDITADIWGHQIPGRLSL